MPSFDFESGMAGAQTGANAGPYGALAGFVISGFLGGGRKKRMKKQIKKAQKRLRTLASPKHFADVTKQLTPLFREQVAGGAGAAAQGAMTNFIARNGLGGTGIGGALTAGAGAIPEIMAFKAALGQAGETVQSQIAAETRRPAPADATGIANEVGQIGDAVQLFKQLSAGSGGGLTRLAPGEFDRRESEAASNATEEFSQQPYDFSQFNYRR